MALWFVSYATSPIIVVIYDVPIGMVYSVILLLSMTHQFQSRSGKTDCTDLRVIKLTNQVSPSSGFRIPICVFHFDSDTQQVQKTHVSLSLFMGYQKEICFLSFAMNKHHLIFQSIKWRQYIRISNHRVPMSAHHTTQDSYRWENRVVCGGLRHEAIRRDKNRALSHHNTNFELNQSPNGHFSILVEKNTNILFYFIL